MFISSGLWHCVIGQVVHDVLKDSSVLKHWELLTYQHCITLCDVLKDSSAIRALAAAHLLTLHHIPQM